MQPLVLWDIDGTLVRGGRSSMVAFHQSLQTVYGLGENVPELQYGGKTDPEIALELLRYHGVDDAMALGKLNRWQEHYCELAEAALPTLRAELVVLPGVRAALEMVSQHGGLNTLLTGNLRPTAALKLTAAGLEREFRWEIGAFGSDDRVRDRLVAIAETKARAHGLQFDQTVVIGDTPRDIQCARAGNARAIAVATGAWSRAELAQHGADIVLPNLADSALLTAAIWGDAPVA